MYPVVINEHSLHLEVGPFAVLFGREFDEGVLQTVARFLVANNFTRQDLPKAGKDELEILVLRDRVQFADKKNLLRWSDFGEWQVAHQLECQRLSSSFSFASQALHGLGIGILFEFLIVSNADGR